MTEFFQFAVLGLGTAAIYTLLAQGAVLIYRGSGVVNFAHGAFALLGAICFAECRLAGVPVAVALVVALVAGMIAGALMQVLVMRQLRDAAPLVRVIATLGVLIASQAGATLHYGDNVTRVDQFLPTHAWNVLEVVVVSDRVILFGIAVLVTLGLWVVQTAWLPAVATRAAAENELAAATLGWSPNALAVGNWAVGGALAAVAGALVVPITGLQVSNVVALLVPALAAALLGRFDSFPKALLGATIIGVGGALTLRYVDQPGATDAVPFLFIVLVLVVTGQGLPLRGHLTDRLPTATRGLVRPLPLVLVFVVMTTLILWVFEVAALDALTVSLSAACILLSVVVVTGFAGQISLAQYAIGGIGVLLAGRLVADAGFPFWLAALLGLLAAVPIGVAFALPALRTRGVTLAVVTLGLAFAVDSMVFNNLDYAGGVGGVPVGETAILGFTISANVHPERYALFALVVFTIAALAVANIRRSPVGRRLIAIRANERAAAALGISVVASKTYAFAVAAAIATVGGILIGFRGATVGLDQFAPMLSLFAVGFVVIGGVGYILGPLVGSLFVVGGVGDLLEGQLFGSSEYIALIGGIVVVLTVLLNPDGVVPGTVMHVRALRDKVTRARAPADDAEPVGDFRVVQGARQPPVGESGLIGVDAGRAPQPLHVHNVTVRYGGVAAVNAASFSVEPAEIVGLIGPNGAGKTTMIDAIAGFVSVAAGTIRLGDRDVTRLRPHLRVRNGLARSWQSLELFEDSTVHENLLVAGDRCGWWPALTAPVRPGGQNLSPAAAAAVSHFGLDDALEQLPGELPYGRQRLVGMARTLALSPNVLLLDEPSAGLDDHESRQLGSLLTEVAHSWSMGILLVEHDMQLVMDICDKVIVLEFGKVIAAGTPDEVRNDKAVIAAYLGDVEAHSVSDHTR